MLRRFIRKCIPKERKGGGKDNVWFGINGRMMDQTMEKTKDQNWETNEIKKKKKKKKVRTDKVGQKDDRTVDISSFEHKDHHHINKYSSSESQNKQTTSIIRKIQTTIMRILKLFVKLLPIKKNRKTKNGMRKRQKGKKGVKMWRNGTKSEKTKNTVEKNLICPTIEISITNRNGKKLKETKRLMEKRTSFNNSKKRKSQLTKRNK